MNRGHVIQGCLGTRRPVLNSDPDRFFAPELSFMTPFPRARHQRTFVGNKALGGNGNTGGTSAMVVSVDDGGAIASDPFGGTAATL
jgi:hypothetical protein